MKKIAILLTVFNRKEKTLKCLESVLAQSSIQGYEVDVYMTNDGCTDGTPEAVAARFPIVHIIHGTGDLYWNRGMYTAWKVASETKDYDIYIWLNDDTLILEDGLRYMLLHYEETKGKAIIVASICSASKMDVTYGGIVDNRRLIPNGKLQECDTFNGNFVLVPRDIFKSIGNLDWTFRHAIGDMDYGYRTRKAGFKIYASKEYLATCDLNPKLPKWARKEVPFRERIEHLYSPLGYAEPIPFFHYNLKNFGLWHAIKYFILTHIRVCFPGLWRKR